MRDDKWKLYAKTGFGDGEWRCFGVWGMDDHEYHDFWNVYDSFGHQSKAAFKRHPDGWRVSSRMMCTDEELAELTERANDQ